MGIRTASAADYGAMRDIYGQYIDTAVTFETELPTAEAFSARIAAVQTVYPCLLWEEDGQILGYAYAHRWKERAAYGWDAELSVYVDAAARRRGIGRALYAALLRLLPLQGVRMAYAVVTLPNEASEGLHAAFGFKRAAVLRNTGFKNGQWRDIALFQLELLPHDGEPAPVTPLDRLGDVGTSLKG